MLPLTHRFSEVLRTHSSKKPLQGFPATHMRETAEAVVKNPTRRELVRRLCQTPRRLTEWSCGDTSDMNGQLARARERARTSQTLCKFNCSNRHRSLFRPRRVNAGSHCAPALGMRVIVDQRNHAIVAFD